VAPTSGESFTDKDDADSIAIRSAVHLTQGYGHRIFDGASADRVDHE
jgi:hypothetical protein